MRDFIWEWVDKEGEVHLVSWLWFLDPWILRVFKILIVCLKAWIVLFGIIGVTTYAQDLEFGHLIASTFPCIPCDVVMLILASKSGPYRPTWVLPTSFILTNVHST